MDEAIRVLYLYDDGNTAHVDSDRLTQSDGTLVVDTAHSVSNARSRFTTGSFDCILSAQQLPDQDGITFLRHIRGLNREIPFILYVDGGNERIASEAISAGVTEYIRTGSDADRVETVVDEITDAVGETPIQSEYKISELTEATDDVLWLLSADWETVLYVNSAYASIWGQSESTLRDDPTAFLDAVHPDDRSRAESAAERLTDGESVEIELRVNPREEFRRRVLVQAEPIRGRDGSVRRIAGVSREVTEQRARQRRLKEEQQLTDSIFSALPDVLYTFDTAGYLIRWNDQLEIETGYTSDEIAEIHVTDFVPEDEVESIAGSFQAIIEDHETVTVESAFETSDDQRIPYEFTGAPIEDEDGELRGITGVGRNVSDRRRRQRRFEAVFDNTYQFTGLMSPDGTLLEVNQTAVEFAGLSREELVGEKIWDAYWFQASETARQIARQSVETAKAGDFFRDQITVQGVDREVVIDFSVRPVTDESGAVELLVPEGRDITRLSEREQQLEVTSRFLRHNIRNKLTTIRGRAELISETDERRLQRHGASIIGAAIELDEAAETARKIHSLIEKDPAPKPVDLSDQLDKAVSIARDRHPEADISVDAPASVEIISTPTVFQGVVELLSVVLRKAKRGRTVVGVDVTRGDTITVTVEGVDTGVTAIEQEVLTGDIELDQTWHAEGLGVWYVYWHVWYSGGEITVSEDRSRVQMHFPTAEAER